jgi:hypothetical protein
MPLLEALHSIVLSRFARVVLLIWSMLKQGVSLLGLVSLTIGFLLLAITELIVYLSPAPPKIAWSHAIRF